jgi:hypothetical protein
MEIVEQTQTLTLDAIEQEAKAKYALAQHLAATAKDAARDAVLAMADCGQMLLMGREHVRGPKGEWIVGLGIPLADAEKAVFLARNREQLELDLWPADVAKVGAQFVGLLPPPGSANRAENDPERSTGAPNHWLSYAGKLNRGLVELFNSRSVDEWREDERTNVKLALKPIVELYEKLCHQCYAIHKSRVQSMIPCMICLQGLGFGIKAIGRNMALGHNTVRTTMMRRGVYNPSGSSRIAGNRELYSTRCNEASFKHRKVIKGKRGQSRTIQLTALQKTRRMLRQQIHRFLDFAKMNREVKTEKYIGCSFQEAKQRIESQFTRGMTWKNYGSFWHLDHIMPLSFFDLSKAEHRARANHISNLRPLKAVENWKKGSKIPKNYQFEFI